MTNNKISLRNRITTAATLAVGAGAITVGALAMSPAAQAGTSMTFEQACGITHGRIAKIAAAGIEQCFWQDPNTGNEWHENSPLPQPYDPSNPPPLGPTGTPASAPSGTTFGQACLVTHGWNAVVVAAGIEECHWQEPDGNEHVISNPLPTKKVPVDKVTVPPVRK